MYFVKFYSSVNRKSVQYTNIRNFQFTRSRNKPGKANFTLDMSPTTSSINAGWLVEVYRDGKRVYWGQVIRKQNKKGHIKVFSHDAIGILNRRLLTQRPIISQEASLEVKEKLDGLELVRGFKLKVNKFVYPTSTSRFWHWEGNKFGDYIKDIGEQVNDISGNPKLYYYWITPNLDVIFEPEGARGYIDDLKFASLTVDDDITQTYNAITVEGLPILKIPYDEDFWTEYLDTGHWEVGGATLSITETLYASAVYSSTNWANTSNSVGSYNGTEADTSSVTNQIVLTMSQFVGDTVGSSPKNLTNIIISAKARGDGLGLKAYLTKDGSECSGHVLSSSMTDTLEEYSATCTHSQGTPVTQSDLDTSVYRIRLVVEDLTVSNTYDQANGSSATGWTNSSYAIGNDDNYAKELYSLTASNIIITMQNFSVPDFDTMDYYNVYISAKRGDSAMNSWTAFVSKDGGSSYCTGHTISPDIIENVSSFTCSHSNAPSTKAELEGNTIKIKIDINGANDVYIDNYAYIDNIYHRAYYNTGLTRTGYVDGAKYSVSFESGADYVTSSFSLDNTIKTYQARSLKNASSKSAISLYTTHPVSTTKNIAGSESDGSYKNLENVTGCYVNYRYAKGGGTASISGLNSVQIIFEDISGETRTWTYSDVTDSGEQQWVENEFFDMDSGYTDSSTEFDVKKVAKHSIVFIFDVSSTTTSQIDLWLDRYYLVQTPYSYTAEDTDSIRRYGRLEKTFVVRNFYSNEECKVLATTLLEHWKNPKLVINCSLSGFIDIEPNTLINIKFDDQEYIKPLSSITYYMNANGTESAQLTIGDFRKSDVGKILDKLAEINRNNNLLINPYQIA